MKDMSTDNRNFVLNQLFSALWCVCREVMPAAAETVLSESTQITGHLIAAAKQSAAIGG